jgi:hypothetical protein
LKAVNALDRSGTELELGRERAALVKADRDIVDGSERLRRQRELLLGLRLRGADLHLAARLEHSLDESLAEWITHRELIRGRIAHLEGLLRFDGQL